MVPRSRARTQTGEVLGITHDAFDTDTAVLTINRQLQELRWRDRGDRSKGFRVPDGFEARHFVDGYHPTRPKSVAGVRELPLPPVLADMMRGWIMVAPPNPWGLVWSTLDGPRAPQHCGHTDVRAGHR